MAKKRGSPVLMAKNMDDRLRSARHVRRAEEKKLRIKLKRMGLIK